MWGMCVRCSQVLLFVEGHICGVCVCVVLVIYRSLKKTINLLQAQSKKQTSLNCGEFYR